MGTYLKIANQVKRYLKCSICRKGHLLKADAPFLIYMEKKI